ncbi:hypothetical protein ACLK1T_13860 [Escherichia coli]
MGELVIAISTVLWSTPPESHDQKLEGDVESRRLRLASLGHFVALIPGKGQKSRNGLNEKRAKKAFSLRAKCCLMTASKPINGTLWIRCSLFKGRRIGMAVACRLAMLYSYHPQKC